MWIQTNMQRLNDSLLIMPTDWNKIHMEERKHGWEGNAWQKERSFWWFGGMWKKLGSLPLNYIFPSALSPLISVLGPYTLPLGKSFGDQKEKCSSSVGTIQGLGSRKLACKTVTPSIERMPIYMEGICLTHEQILSPQTGQDLSRTCSKLPLSILQKSTNFWWGLILP